MIAARPARSSADDRLLQSVRDGARREAASRRSTRELREAPVEAKPELRLVPKPRRRFRLVAVVYSAIFTLMFVATALQIHLAQSQLEVDRIEQGVEIARDRFTDLRKQNASLRSPDRLLAEARAMGMVTGRAKEFAVVSPEISTMVVRAAGPMLDAATPPPDPFADHERIKRVNHGDAP